MNNIVSTQNVVNEVFLPAKIVKFHQVKNCANLRKIKPVNVSFHTENMAVFQKQGSFVVLDFGKELCGGVRFIIRDAKGIARFRVRFGESLSEAMTPLGVKNAGNDHSPREFYALTPTLSDLTFGQSGFRFAYIELCTDKPVLVQNIMAVNTLPAFPFEAKIVTNDDKLNKILDTAAYTLKLCCQNGYIWDGIKRDRLVWSGDMHQEILTAFYLFGDNENICNSLNFVKKDTKINEWANWIPSYSAWWIINLCEYCDKSGNKKFFRQNKVYAEEVLKHINGCIDKDGNMEFPDTNMPFFLDWPTFHTEDAVIGTASVLIMAAERFLALCRDENADAVSITQKLKPVLEQSKPINKQTLAMQYLACTKDNKTAEKLERNGAEGFSTFMAYYILKAYASAGGKNCISIIKDYFGGMLSRGATTFWEDFDLKWLNGSGRIDELPADGELDIHGDFGRFCYEKFRHSLCHGWSSGVFAFFVEHILGLQICGGRVISVNSNLYGLTYIKAELPIGKKIMCFDVTKNGTEISCRSLY